jgi:hypothetical protein
MHRWKLGTYSKITRYLMCDMGAYSPVSSCNINDCRHLIQAVSASPSSSPAMPPPHESIFTYPLSRPYPFRWYTPAVIVGTLCLLALFSYLNVAMSGYELVLQTTFDPNATIAQHSLKSWPSWGFVNSKYVTPRYKVDKS